MVSELAYGYGRWRKKTEAKPDLRVDIHEWI